MPTTNPVPSTDPSDLLFNAGKLDEVVNGTANSFTDRLGATRRTVAGMNADFDAQLADAESDLNVYRADAAASAAEALGYLQTIRATSYGAYAEDPATDPLGNPPTVGDEYFNTTANLLKRWNGTTWQASDINTANLAAPSGSSLIGHLPEGVGAVATTVQQQLRDIQSWTVNVKDAPFYAKGDGVTDDTAAIQAAIDYCKSKLTAVNNSTNGGHATLYFPQGMYKVSSTLNLSGVVGFKIAGSGSRTTQIVFAGSSGVLFYYSAYIYCSAEYITFRAGTISLSGGLPQVTGPTVKDSTCFRFNGNGGGTDMKFENCQFMHWNKVFTTIDSTVNDDGHHHYNCQFLYNSIVWDNTNTQAVIWSFTDCKVFYNTGTVFKNPGSSLFVRGGDFINPGDFLEATLTSCGVDSSFTDIRFENYQNIDPSSAPRILVLSGSHTGLVFDRCSARGGGSLAGKTSATISGVFAVTMRDCQSLSGNWEISVDSSSSSITSLLTLENTVLTINQTVSGGVGNRPININYINYPNSTLSRISRYFRGATGSQATPISAKPMVDAITFQQVVNASTTSRSIPVFVTAPYQLILTGVKFIALNNTATAFDLIVWKDSTKAVKLCEALGLNANGAHKVFTATPATWPQFTSTSNPLFVEVTSTGNAGTISGQISFEFMQTY